ncbi:hypothetical protein [Streptomyces sp. NPDC001020]
MTYAGTRRRRGRGYAALAVCGALLAGCSGAADGDGGNRQGRTASASPTAAASARAGQLQAGAATPRFMPDPARIPRTRSAALGLVRAVTAGPDSYGPGFGRRAPYESEPTGWTVLGADCIWRRKPLPADVLATLTRYSRLPASGSKGEVRTAAVATVHRSTGQADWEMAKTLEEALRCPDQQLRATERITGLNSIGSGYGSNGNTSADDSLVEIGSYDNPALGKGSAYYLWNKVRLGPITLAVVVEGGRGYDAGSLRAFQARAVADMETKVRTELGTNK